MSSSRVSYYWHDETPTFSYGPDHPMKPYRIRLAHELISSYDLLPKMACYKPQRLTKDDLIKFHTDDFIDFLADVTPQHQVMVNQATEKLRRMSGAGHNNMSDEQQDNEPVTAEAIARIRAFQKYGVDNDCPMFEGLYKFCELYGGGSVGGAWKLNRKTADIAINWSGGLHHAKKAEVSGFCYVNDIVLAIIELLRYHPRVLYIDIDVHHGDGVEEAFYTTDRVMTVSFHRHGDNFFPGTGALTDTGVDKGKNYSINFPLADGIDDQSYENIFKSVIGGVMQHYRPTAIVLQCGADSLTGDKLGPFNLTLKGHGFCVDYCKSLGVPLLLLGGGGYTVKNVARCWAYETALALGVGKDLPNELPYNNYIKYWGPDYMLHLKPMAERPNCNSPRDLQMSETAILQQLKDLAHAPSVSYDTHTPRDSSIHEWRESREAQMKESEEMDASHDGTYANGKQHQSEFFAGPNDQDGTTMGIVRQKPQMPLFNAPSTPTVLSPLISPLAASSSSSSSLHAPMEH